MERRLKTGKLVLSPRGLTTTSNLERARTPIWQVIKQQMPGDRPVTVAMLTASQEGAPQEERFELRETVASLLQAGCSVHQYGIGQTGDASREDILSADVIYLSGGAPYWHLAHFKLLGITKGVLQSYLDFGGVVVASSAGAMVLGTNVSGICEAGKVAWAKQGPDIGVDYDKFGLGLIDEQVIPHPVGIDAFLVRILRFSSIRKMILKSLAEVKVLWDGEVSVVDFPRRMRH